MFNNQPINNLDNLKIKSFQEIFNLRYLSKILTKHE